MTYLKINNFIKSIATFACLSLSSISVNAETVFTPSRTTKDALLHVLAHEIGHAVLREFDLPILGPEEDIADDFATLFIYHIFPDRAEFIIEARAAQNMADNKKPGRFSEHRDDQQRAGRSICLLYGQDPQRFQALANRNGLKGNDAAACRDFATEVGRSWRRVLRNYLMPPAARVTEVGQLRTDGMIARGLEGSDFKQDAYQLLSGIDWHSSITLALVQCDGQSVFIRNGRRITICNSYIKRFEEQLTD